ncbi:glycosyltransferase family 2 protein [Fibrobacter succinogenes]|uniref:glycosyltransferase family 2 protein n=1 Tax=Fibrobacter succinogenes TaxID=833 RepID=UPI001568D5B9|nr:glycosyltransferase family 2 protein [Fibrobacter succinogenes]
MSVPGLPLISVLVPVYNIERYIGVCLESIIKQKYHNLDIIVVDDGSTDRSGEICDLYAQKDYRIKVIHKANGGLVSARKAAMQAARGSFIGYVDGDDWISPDYYSDLFMKIEGNGCDAVVAGFSRDLFDSSTPMSNVVSAGCYEGEKLENLFSNMISTGAFFRHGITTYLWNKLFKREIVEDIQLEIDDRISIGEDGAVVYPALLKCKRVFVTNNFSYHYRQREDSMLKKSKPFEQEISQLQILYNQINRAIGRYPTNLNLRLQLQKYLLSTCIIRSGGIVDSAGGTKLFPFEKDLKGKRVAICGAGTFGQQLEKRLRERNHCNIMIWVDYDYWEYRRCCLNVDPLEKLIETEFDFIVLGTVDSQATQSMRERLVSMGIEFEKILSIRTEDDKVEIALSHYLNLDSQENFNEQMAGHS